MSALITIGIALASVIAYLALMVAGWRLGYVWGYEAKAGNRLVGYSWNTSADVGRTRGIVAALLAPVMVPALLIGKYATPVPPTLAKERQRETDRRIAALERELGIGGGCG